ncbi:hypothetical protein PSAC2689_130079 [Paraburkholderia sacchari]
MWAPQNLCVILQEESGTMLRQSHPLM